MKNSRLIKILAVLILLAIMFSIGNIKTFANTDEQNLTKEQLEEIEKYFNTNSGDTLDRSFLVNQPYDSPKNLDFYEFFYNGTGDSSSITSEELEELKKAWNFDDSEIVFPPTDIAKSSTTKIKEILKANFGLEFTDEEIKNQMGDTYLEKYDAYYTMHGDTNTGSRPVMCFGGTSSGDNYSILLYFECKAGNDNVYGETTNLKLKKDGDKYIILSNEHYSMKPLVNSKNYADFYSWSKDMLETINQYTGLQDVEYTVSDFDHDNKNDLIVKTGGVNLFWVYSSNVLDSDGNIIQNIFPYENNLFSDLTFYKYNDLTLLEKLKTNTVPEEEEVEKKDTTTATKSIPQTGDNSIIIVCSALIMMAIAIFIVIKLRKKYMKNI